jgi:hypothetical protein
MSLKSSSHPVNFFFFLKKKTNSTHRIVLTMLPNLTDESDPAFWSEVRAYGWVYFNHTEEKTLERLGEWYLPIVDVVSQSLAMGFVGTSASTFSLLSARRVEEWNGGSTTYVHKT